MRSCPMAAAGRATPERRAFTWSCCRHFRTSTSICRRSSSDRRASAKRLVATARTKANGSSAPPPDRRWNFASSSFFPGISRDASSPVNGFFSCHECRVRGARHSVARARHDALHACRYTARLERTGPRVVGCSILRLARPCESCGLVGDGLERDYVPGGAAVAGYAGRPPTTAHHRQHRPGSPEAAVPTGWQCVLHHLAREAARRRNARDHGLVPRQAPRGAATPLGWWVHVREG